MACEDFKENTRVATKRPIRVREDNSLKWIKLTGGTKGTVTETDKRETQHRVRVAFPRPEKKIENIYVWVEAEDLTEYRW